MTEPEPPDADSIVHLKGLEAIRYRPELYVGPLDDPGCPQYLFRETLCHPADQSTKGACTQVSYFVDDSSFGVTFDCGLPLEEGPDGRPLFLMLLDTLRACADYKEHPSQAQDLCVSGIAVVVALSARFRADVSDGELGGWAVYEKGNLKDWTLSSTSCAPRTAFHVQIDRQLLGPQISFGLAPITCVASGVAQAFEGLTLDQVSPADWRAQVDHWQRGK